MIEYTPFPANFAAEYRKLGYWSDLPLCDILTRHAKDDQIAVIDGDLELSYVEFERKSTNLAAALQRRGLKQYDTALVHIGNHADLYIVFFALLKIGVAPVNALYSHRQLELSAYAEQIQPKLLIGDRANPLFTSDTFLDHLRTVSPELNTWAFRGDGSLDSLYEESTQQSEFKACPTNDVAFFNLSGGSTGTPKLIPRTHNDYYYSVVRSVEVCEVTAATKLLVAIPAAHNFPMSSPGSLGVFYAGGTVVLANDPSSATCFPLIAKHQVTLVSLVPPAAAMWLQDIQTNQDQDLKSLKVMQLGGSRLSPTLASKIAKQFGCKLQQVFGMAEGLVNYTRLDDSEHHIITTQGRPMSPSDEVWVAGPDGEKLGVDEVGLLMTRGPYTFRGYYKAPQHNAKSFNADGFYCSGDLISIDKDGYITVQGREKGQINRGGEKVSSEEIENLIMRHPDVIEAALVSKDDEMLGEKSVAFIVASKPVKMVAMRRFLRDQGIAEYKLPDKIVAIDEMPLTPVGKVNKVALRTK